jgi:hypothetical protein
LSVGCEHAASTIHVRTTVRGPIFAVGFVDGVVRPLVEMVVGVFSTVGLFWSPFRVINVERQKEFINIILMVRNVKLIFNETSDFPCRPRLACLEKLAKSFPVVIVEFRRTAVAPRRRESLDATIVPPLGPSSTCGLRSGDAIGGLTDRVVVIEVFDENEAPEEFRIVRLVDPPVEFVFGEVAFDVFSSGHVAA